MTYLRVNYSRFKDKVAEHPIDRKVYVPPTTRKEISRWLTNVGFGCPLGMDRCGKLDEIVPDYSPRNVFVAIPYSKYIYEEAIRQVLTSAKLRAILAKDRIETISLMCNICKAMRKCAYMVADISRQNDNVTYELGLMTSFGKDCAILFSKRIRKNKPSDLEGLMDVRYHNSKNLKKQLGRWVRDNVSEADKKSLGTFLKRL